MADYGTDVFNYTWWGRMFTDIDFWQKWIDRYEDLRTGLFSTNHIYADINALAAQVRQEQPREVARWPGFTTPRSGTVSISGYSYDFPGTYQGEVDFLKQWYRDRLQFMDTNFLAKPVFSSKWRADFARVDAHDQRPGWRHDLLLHGWLRPAPARRSGLAHGPGLPLPDCPEWQHRDHGPGPRSQPSQPHRGQQSAALQSLVGLHHGHLWLGDLAGPGGLRRCRLGLCPELRFAAQSRRQHRQLGQPGDDQRCDLLSGQSPRPGLPGPDAGWAVAAWASRMRCAAGTVWGPLAAKVGASEGDQSTGGLISFGSTNNPAASANRALGLLATSSTGPTAFGLRLVNGTGFVLNRMDLHFTGELWRQSAVAKRLSFGYFIDPVATNDFSTNLTALLPSLDVSFPAAPAAKTPVPVDGTAAANQVALGVTGQVITNWPPGAALWLVWLMADASGKGQGLAIDNLTFSASAQPVLAIQAAGANLILSWPYGELQSASNATGPFSTLTGVTSPFTNVPAGTRQFYRVVVP